MNDLIVLQLNGKVEIIAQNCDQAGVGRKRKEKGENNYHIDDCCQTWFSANPRAVFNANEFSNVSSQTCPS
jgi:hypothetical protein